MCYLHLRNVKGYKFNHKRVYRIYKELNLNMRIKPKKRIKREKPNKLIVPTYINECWSMDFMHHSTSCGKSFRLLNIIDDYNGEGLAIEVDYSLNFQRLIKTLEQIMEHRGKPKSLRSDNGPEFISKSFIKWANDNDIELKFIQPGNPQQNAYIERFNRTVRYDWLNLYIYDDIYEIQDLATHWLYKYNNDRPNSAIGGITPWQKLKRKQNNSLNSTIIFH